MIQKYKTAITSGVAILSVIFLCFVIAQVKTNGAIAREETVEQAKSDVAVQIDRKINLLTELVQCVEQYDSYEYNTLMDVIKARTKDAAGDVNSTEIMNQVQAVAEAYPDLKSQKNYGKLMDNISETENLLSQHKKAYNTSVKAYRTYTRKFPNKQFLDMSGYEVIDYELYTTTNTDGPMNLF